MARSDSKKRKIEELDYEELGEPIQGEKSKSAAVKRLEASSERFIPGFCINLKWCESSKYSELLDILEAQNWIKLFSECYDNVIAHAPLKEFCANFKNINGVCVSKVKNKKISFDADDLAAVFGTPNEGFDKYFKGETELSVEGVSIEKIVESIGGKASKVRTNHNLFSPIQKLLFIFVHLAIIPRTQHRHEANHLDAVLIYCLENKIQINFPSLMIQHLTHCLANHLKVGYANLIITLLESCGISMTNYESLKLKTNHYVQPKTLEARNLTVVEGTTQFLSKSLSKPKQDESSLKKKEDEELDKWLEEEDSEKEGEQERKEVIVMSNQKDTQSSGKRKSTRLAIRPRGKDKAESAEVVDLSEERNSAPGDQGILEEKTGSQGEQGILQASVEKTFPTGSGFAGFSTVSSTLELKALKETVQN